MNNDSKKSKTKEKPQTKIYLVSLNTSFNVNLNKDFHEIFFSHENLKCMWTVGPTVVGFLY